MKVATILPQAFLHHTEYDDYFMALGHLINASGFEKYTKFFETRGKDVNSFVMLDTGLIEGNPRPIDELVSHAKQIHADEMSLIDVYMDHTETLRESHDSLEYILSDGIDVQTMGIPQGTHLQDWLECAKEMLRWPIDTIGIPKVLTHLEGSHARIHALLEIQDLLGDKDVHLLGCWETPLELKMVEACVRQGEIKPVRGCDSAIAYAYAREGLLITEDERPEGEIDFAATHCEEGLLARNIAIWKNEAKTLPSLEEARKHKIYYLK